MDGPGKDTISVKLLEKGESKVDTTFVVSPSGASDQAYIAGLMQAVTDASASINTYLTGAMTKDQKQSTDIWYGRSHANPTILTAAPSE